MKKSILALMIIGTMSFEGRAQTESESKTETFTVYGNCGMCERTIESAVGDKAGVISADWDQATHQMTVNYNPSLITLDQIKEKIAEKGYDSDTHRASDKAYNSLPGCCKYERPE